MSVSKVGGIFVHKTGEAPLGQKSTLAIRETAVQEALTPTQEAEAQELAQAITAAAQADLLEVARTLVASTPAALFGANEFKIRDLILRVAATA